MTSIVTRKFRIYNAQQFVESFNEINSASENSTPFLLGESLNSINYVFIAKSTSWGTPDDPTTPVDKINETEYQHWREMLSASRVDAGDVASVIRKYEWVTGTAYREYNDDDETLFNIIHTAGSPVQANQPFYVTVKTNNINRVYKCLYANNGSASTVQPTHTGFQANKNSDGYIWKLMYETASIFDTANFLEVEDGIPANRSVPGGIYNITPAGSSDFLFITKQLGGQTEGSANTVDIGTTTEPDLRKLIGSTFAVDRNPTGRDFAVVESVTGTTLNLDSNINFDSTTPRIFVSPQVIVDGDGDDPVNAIATPSFAWTDSTTDKEVSGPIFDIDMGQLTDTQTIAQATATVGSGFSRATATAAQGIFADLGLVFANSNGGLLNRSTGNNIDFTTLGLSAGITIILTDGTETRTYQIRTGEITTDTIGIENASTTGNFGTVTNGVSGTVDNLIEDNLTPIIGIPGGHGISPIEELKGNYVMVAKELNGIVIETTTNIPTFTVANNFRKIGLLRNPLDANGNRIFTKNIDQTYKIPISSATDSTITNLEVAGNDFLAEDHSVIQTGSNFTGKLVDHVSYLDTNGVNQFRLRLTEISDGDDFVPGNDLQIVNASDVNVGSSFLASDTPENGDLSQFLGEIIYIEHREPLRRSSDQTENVRLVIEF